MFEMKKLTACLVLVLMAVGCVLAVGCGKKEEPAEEIIMETAPPVIESTVPETTAPPPTTQPTSPPAPAPPPPSDVKDGLTEAQRKQAFWDLVVAQDSGISDAEAYAVVSAKYDVSVNVLRDIAYEGVANNWPVPPAP